MGSGRDRGQPRRPGLGRHGYQRPLTRLRDGGGARGGAGLHSARTPSRRAARDRRGGRVPRRVHLHDGCVSARRRRHGDREVLSGPVLVIERDGGLGAALAQHGYEVDREGDPAAARALVTAAPRPTLRLLAELEPEAWLATFREWTEEPFFAAQRFLRSAYQHGRGACWIAVTSILGTQPFPGGGPAGAASIALHTLVRVAAIEGGPHGVRANVVAAGWREDAFPPGLDAQLAVEDTPARRLATEADVAAAVAWLLSDGATHI